MLQCRTTLNRSESPIRRKSPLLTANGKVTFMPHILELSQVVKIITNKPETMDFFSKRSS